MREDEQGNKWVTVSHPATGGKAEITEAMLEEVYSDLGWVLAEDDSTEAVVDPDASPPPPEDAGDMKSPEVTPEEEVHG